MNDARFRWRFAALWTALVWLATIQGLMVQDARAETKGELKFLVQLVWGTNGEKPAGQDLKDVEPRITEGLKGIFKWKNYYEVSRKNLNVARDKTQRLKLSDKCEIEVQNLGNSAIEVKLIGEGKLVNTLKQGVNPDTIISIGGGDKNDTAWFVVLKPQ